MSLPKNGKTNPPDAIKAITPKSLTSLNQLEGTEHASIQPFVMQAAPLETSTREGDAGKHMRTEHSPQQPFTPSSAPATKPTTATPTEPPPVVKPKE